MIDLILTWLSRRSKLSTGKAMRGDYYCLDCGNKNCKNPAHTRFSKVKPLICPACEQADCCNDLVSEWKTIPNEELDKNISEFIKSKKIDFVTAQYKLMIRSHNLDNELSTRLEQAFTRLAPHYIDHFTENLIRKWEQMNDEDVELELVKLQTEKSKEEFYEIWAFLYPEELKSRLEKLLLYNVTPKVRHINLMKMIKRWESLSNEELMTEIKIELFGTGWNSSTSHFTFVRDLYPNIGNDILRERVNRVLLSIMDPSKPVDSDMALYACSHLNIPGTVETYQELVHRARQESKKA